MQKLSDLKLSEISPKKYLTSTLAQKYNDMEIYGEMIPGSILYDTFLMTL